MSKQVYAKGERLALKEEVDAALLLKQDVLSAGDNISIDNNVISAINPQYEEMPEASAELEGKVIQYVGDTNEYYTTAYYYICEDDGQGGYTWNEINVQSEVELPEDLKVFYVTEGNNSSNPFIFGNHEPGIYFLKQPELGIGNMGTAKAYFKGFDSSSSVIQVTVSYDQPILYVKDINETNADEYFAYHYYKEVTLQGVSVYKRLFTKSSDASIGLYVGEASSAFSGVSLYNNQTVSGVKTFSSLPESSATPTTANQLTNKAYVDSKLSAAVKRSVVQELPSSDIDENTIYMTPAEDPSTGNVYDEYIYVNNSWEKIGSTAIDLTNYYTKTEIDAKYYHGIETEWDTMSDTTKASYRISVVTPVSQEQNTYNCQYWGSKGSLQWLQIEDVTTVEGEDSDISVTVNLREGFLQTWTEVNSIYLIDIDDENETFTSSEISVAELEEHFNEDPEPVEYTGFATNHRVYFDFDVPTDYTEATTHISYVSKNNY